MRVPIASGAAEIEVKKSRFLSRADYFDDPDTIKQVTDRLRERHAGCNHVVYAFVVGESGDLHGMSDDHEPKGTAGRPVLEVVKGTGITNVIVTVVRFFGGTKLGTGGLVRAYTEAAQRALAAATTEELIRRIAFDLRVPYAIFESAKRIIEDLSGDISAEEFAEIVTLSGRIPLSKKECLESALADASGGRAIPVFHEGSSES